MTVHVQPEFVCFVAARFEPIRIECAVKLYAGEPFLLRFVDPRDRFGLACRDIGDLRGVGSFAVDQGRGIHVREKEIAFRGALTPVDRASIVVARIANGSNAER